MNFSCSFLNSSCAFPEEEGAINDIRSSFLISHGVGLLEVERNPSGWGEVRILLAGLRGGGGKRGGQPLEFERERTGLIGPSHSVSDEGLSII